MSRDRYPRSYVPIAVFALAACAANRPVIRNEIQFAAASSLTLDGLTVSAKLLDVSAVKNDPRLAKKVAATMGGVLPMNVGWTVLEAPAFELRVRNQTGHVVRLQGAVIKLIDGAGNLYEALDRGTALADLEDDFTAARARGYEITPRGAQELQSALSQVKFLSENAQLLPEFTETFIVAFRIPHDHTEEGLNNWLAQQASLLLKVYEVPTRTNEAGVVTKRVSFEFPVRVNTFRETYEDGPDGKKLVVTEQLPK